MRQEKEKLKDERKEVFTQLEKELRMLDDIRQEKEKLAEERHQIMKNIKEKKINKGQDVEQKDRIKKAQDLDLKKVRMITKEK